MENKPIVIQRPFAIFVEPGDVVDGKLQWYAKIVGHQFDNLVWSDDGPIGALKQVIEFVKAVTDVREN